MDIKIIARIVIFKVSRVFHVWGHNMKLIFLDDKFFLFTLYSNLSSRDVKNFIIVQRSPRDNVVAVVAIYQAIYVSNIGVNFVKKCIIHKLIIQQTMRAVKRLFW